MEQTIGTTAFITPVDKEKVEAIIKATCEYYGITEATLLADEKEMAATAIRRQCYFLISQNTDIKADKIAKRFKRSRMAVVRGASIIESHKAIYAQTSRSLKAIVMLANTFDKTTEWLIQ